MATIYLAEGRQISPGVFEKLSRNIPSSAWQKRGLSGKIEGLNPKDTLYGKTLFCHGELVTPLFCHREYL